MAHGVRNDGLQRREPVGKRRRSWLEYQRRFDLVQRAALHRGNTIETGPPGDFLRSEFLAAPRADNDVWRVMDYFLSRHDAVLG